jgi:peroxiredoxin
MARTPSTMLPLGTAAAPFSLPDPTGKLVSLDDFAAAKALVVMFICNHCPFVKHVAGEIAQLARDYQPRGVAFVGIQPNDAEKYPADSPEKMAEEIALRGYTFPYLSDDTQAVAKAYRAACTPDFYVFDAAKKLIYRGQLDASRPDNGKPVTGADLRAALDAVLAHQPVADDQLPSLGCNIKWRPGNEPDYFG